MLVPLLKNHVDMVVIHECICLTIVNHYHELNMFAIVLICQVRNITGGDRF